MWGAGTRVGLGAPEGLGGFLVGLDAGDADILQHVIAERRQVGPLGGALLPERDRREDRRARPLQGAGKADAVFAEACDGGLHGLALRGRHIKSPYPILVARCFLSDETCNPAGAADISESCASKQFFEPVSEELDIVPWQLGQTMLSHDSDK